ncbi:hypothetical protein SNE40_017583 [Patella caerulea]|uniref:Uncharacterized protein n=1 Tax=Patella caerulea TaxID=87958 RepID=A0AAN8JF96_PATCE
MSESPDQDFTGFTAQDLSIAENILINNNQGDTTKFVDLYCDKAKNSKPEVKTSQVNKHCRKRKSSEKITAPCKKQLNFARTGAKPTCTVTSAALNHGSEFADDFAHSAAVTNTNSNRATFEDTTSSGHVKLSNDQINRNELVDLKNQIALLTSIVDKQLHKPTNADLGHHVNVYRNIEQNVSSNDYRNIEQNVSSNDIYSNNKNHEYENFYNEPVIDLVDPQEMYDEFQEETPDVLEDDFDIPKIFQGDDTFGNPVSDSLVKLVSVPTTKKVEIGKMTSK